MRKAFTFIEMIFVIVIMGILAKFGAEIFRNVYLNYNQSVTNNKLQTDTEAAITQISNRLQYRIKNSVIERNSATNVYQGLTGVVVANNSNVLEWVGYDIDGWRGDATATTPTWSGFIDVDDLVNANANTLVSPVSDFQAGGRVDNMILALSGGNSDITDSSIFFTGSNNNVLDSYGWNGVAQNEQSTTAAHQIGAALAPNRIVPGVDDFAGVDVYEQYKLAWTAYALELTGTTLTLYYDYQPWKGESYSDVNVSSAILMQDVDTFKFQGVGDMIKLQVCVTDNNFTGEGGYSICKEKAIF